MSMSMFGSSLSATKCALRLRQSFFFQSVSKAQLGNVHWVTLIGMLVLVFQNITETQVSLGWSWL